MTYQEARRQADARRMRHKLHTRILQHFHEKYDTCLKAKRMCMAMWYGGNPFRAVKQEASRGN